VPSEPKINLARTVRALVRHSRQLIEHVQELTDIIEASLPAEDLSFVPTPFQKAILDALDGKAMKTDQLGHAVKDRRRLFKENGLAELMDLGLVSNHSRLGYYRPDSPPEELST